MLSPEEATYLWEQSASLLEVAPNNPELRSDHARVTLRPGPSAFTPNPTCPVCDLLPSGAHWTGCPVGEAKHRGQR